MGVPQSDGRVVMAQSMYPKEGNPLWENSVPRQWRIYVQMAYTHYTFDYPYPSA